MAIGFLDLLGVSSRIVNGELEDMLRVYENRHLAIEASKVWFGASGHIENQRVESFVFSDSVLFASTIDNLALITAVTASTYEHVLNSEGTPARGVVTTGLMCINKETNFVLGKPLVQAAAIEKCLDAPCLVIYIPNDNKHQKEEVEKFNWISTQAPPLKENAPDLARKDIDSSDIYLIRYYAVENDLRKTLLSSKRVLEGLVNGAPKRVNELMQNGIRLCDNELNLLERETSES